jgi:hypothetical protein
MNLKFSKGQSIHEQFHFKQGISCMLRCHHDELLHYTFLMRHNLIEGVSWVQSEDIMIKDFPFIPRILKMFINLSGNNDHVA